MQWRVIPRVTIVAFLVVFLAASMGTRAAGAAPALGAGVSKCKQDTTRSEHVDCHGHLVLFLPCSPNGGRCTDDVFRLESDGKVPYNIAGVIPRPKGPQSLQDFYGLELAETSSGIFTVQALNRFGAKLKFWSPGLILLRPTGYSKLEMLTLHGWVPANNTSVERPGLYRWVSS
jgi:hypothetical protein